MKSLLFISLLWFGTLSPLSNPRIVEKTLQLIGGDKVEIDLRYADGIIVEAWDKDEVYIKASIQINDGKWNSALVLDFTELDDRLFIGSSLPDSILERSISPLWRLS